MSGDVAELLSRLATTATALTILAAFAWWIVGPRVREFLGAQQLAADVVAGRGNRVSVSDKLDHLGEQLTASSAQLAQVIDRLDSHDDELAALRGRQDNVDQRLSDWHAQAAAELSLTRAARILAAGRLD